MLVLEYRSLESLEEAQRDDLIGFGKTVSMASANAICFADIEHQATHDALTNLPNRTMLHRALLRMMGEAIAQRQVLGLILLDLDRFKEINDTLGHHIGDELLRAISSRLQAVVGDDHNTLCRLGGDEFAIAVAKTDEEAVKQVARAVLHALKEPVQIVGSTLSICASIGISYFPRQSGDIHELLRYADIAMYNAKRSGASIGIYNPDFDEHSPDRLALMTELMVGIRENQLVLHYQPKINLATGSISGYEALVRWQHPQRGLLGPDMFIPLAEMGQAIQPLTLKVVEMALIQQQRWRAAGLPHHMAINLSTRNLIDHHCLAELKTLLTNFAIEPGAVEFEITETALMTDPKAAAAALSSFAEIGVRLSIDDFGTGYSSLSHLIRLPINALKIDRSFVKDMVMNKQDAGIVKSTIGLAHNLNLEVVAEGVEDAITLDLLKQYGCNLAQGYHISRPLPADMIEKLF
jgi:diguanylate cyclase (GGDEF)-like protein